jgi:hypothetical protein
VVLGHGRTDTAGAPAPTKSVGRTKPPRRHWPLPVHGMHPTKAPYVGSRRRVHSVHRVCFAAGPPEKAGPLWITDQLLGKGERTCSGFH